jgi:hypothetical protein
VLPAVDVTDVDMTFRVASDKTPPAAGSAS